MSLEHRQTPDVLTSDTVDDSIGSKENLSDVVAPELWHDASAERRRRLVLGIPGAASRVLGLHGLLELGRLSPHALAQRTELGLHDAQRLLAALELGRRVHAARSRRPRRLRSPRDIARFFEPTLAPLVHEELWMAALDVHHGARGVRMLSRGGPSAYPWPITSSSRLPGASPPCSAADAAPALPPVVRDANQGRPPPLRIPSYRWQRHPITVVDVHGSGRAHVPLQARCLAPVRRLASSPRSE
ncbi:hypothetical protein [Sorangium sp. So ce341]|uniref:hypothetical protein n=1 Tax=Sorangium sp. So ce341 TaxID=3133302 RepID=UPI003F60AF64